MEKKEKVKQVFKYIFLGMALTTYGFIFYHSSIVPKTSDKWNSWAKDIWVGLINDALGIKEDTSIVKPEEITLSDKIFISNDSYKSSNIDGYDEHEIPLGGEKWLEATISPRITTNKSISYVASNDKVKLIQSGLHVDIEAMELGDVTIKAICNADNSVTAEYRYSIIERKAPEEINFFCDYLTVGQSKYLNVGNFSNDLETNKHFYDYSKLSFTSSDESVAVIRGEYLKAIAPGKTTISVSNGIKEWNNEVIVTANESTLSNVTDINVKGDNTVYVRGLDYDKYTQLEVEFDTDSGNEPTDKGVIWSVDNPLAAYVSQDGRVWGNKYISDGDVDFTVRATSVDNLSIYKDYNMRLTHITPTNILLEPKMVLDNGYYIANNSKSVYVGINYDAPYITKFNYQVVVSDSSVIKAEMVGAGLIVVGLKEGNATLYVVSNDDPNLKSNEIKIEVRTRGYINDDNIETFTYIVRKYISGHAFLFMIAAIFTSLYVYFAHMNKSNKVILLSIASVLGVGLIFGVISECIQLIVPGRVGAFEDVLIDMSGTFLGVLFIFAIAGIRILIQNKKKKKVEINS
ncbi:MAG: VanZ family protein [Bacilli bacterium]|nr:VanZ family protein [Bacilli bacterium]